MIPSFKRAYLKREKVHETDELLRKNKHYQPKAKRPSFYQLGFLNEPAFEDHLVINIDGLFRKPFQQPID
jgi:hypothetical protein